MLAKLFIIGTQKGGTTSLWHYLRQHPLFLSSRVKEPHFFDKPQNYRKGRSFYESLFPAWRGRLLSLTKIPNVLFESTPSMLFCPHSPQRVLETVGEDVRFVVLLRNPIDRAYSHYRHSVRRGLESESFETALALERDRIGDLQQKWLDDPDFFDSDLMTFSYFSRGRYDEQLNRWLQYFPRSRFLILESEAFFQHPKDTIARVCHLVGLKPLVTPDTRPQNTGGREEALDPAVREHLIQEYRSSVSALTELLEEPPKWAVNW